VSPIRWDHPHCSTPLNPLYKQFQNKSIESELNFQKVLDAQESRYGNENPAIVQTLYYMSYIYRLAQMHDKAERLLWRIVHIQEK
jgi:hypothetical protein